VHRVGEVAGRKPAPVLVILEDMQWVGSESIRLWNWLARAADGLRLLLAGSFRKDEAPSLPAAVERTQVLPLGRLDREAIGALSDSMIGPAGRRPALLALLA